ncbi:hypothetical protein [Mesorhizobium sp.]|uniref:hypothetical protein n=2 Tax=unclassified Mesorhizobium TaxID=325217 RepID=UPI000FE854E4|nr:hypothetical protein [Mesorhizobium sp.]RWG26250.1 MAG: hypothetical protein EOQ60_27810 [Mesorhizobium sp.]
MDPATVSGINQPPGVPTYVPPGVEGYDPVTGEVAPSKPSLLGALGALSASVLNGVPIVGPALLDKTEDASAYLNSLSKGTPFADEKYATRQGLERAIEADPLSATSGNVIGAVTGTAPAVAAAPELFGAGAASLPARILASTGSGAALGGTDAAVRSGGDPTETWHGTAWGAGGGAAAVPLGAIVGKLGSVGAQKVADALYWYNHGSEVPGDVAKSIVSNLERQGDTVGSAVQKVSDMGLGSTLADSGPAAQGMAVKLAAQYPEVGPQMAQNLTQRTEQLGPRMNAAVEAAAGPDVNAPQMMAQLKATTAANGKANYDAAFANPAKVDVNPVVAKIDSEIFPTAAAGTTPDPISAALQDARGYIAGPNFGNGSIEALHRAQDVIDDMASSAFRSGDSAKARALWGVRSTLLNQMDTANPAYAAARAQYASDKAIENAFENGRSIFAPKSDGQVYDPDLLESRLSAMSQPEKDAFQLGTRKALADTMGQARTDAAGVQAKLANDSGYAVQKLRQVIGDAPTDQLLQELDNQAAMQATNRVVLGNSKTAMASAADADIPTATPLGAAAHGGGHLAGAYIGSRLGELAGGYFGHPELGEAIGLGASAGMHKVANAINASREASAALARSGVANVLTAPMRQNVIDALMSYERGLPDLAAIRQGAKVAARAIAPTALQTGYRLISAPQQPVQP